jgi:N-acetylglucosamine repressor
MTAKRTGNRQLMQELNNALVLNLIREAECISQVDIQNKTSLSAGTISRITKELKGQDFIETVGLGKSTTGRKPTLMRFNPKAGYVISGVFFSETVNVAILDLVGNIKNQMNFPTEKENGPPVYFYGLPRKRKISFRNQGSGRIK